MYVLPGDTQLNMGLFCLSSLLNLLGFSLSSLISMNFKDLLTESGVFHGNFDNKRAYKREKMISGYNRHIETRPQN